MTDHIRGMAQSVAMAVTFGPNPQHAFRFFRDEAHREALRANPSRHGRLQKELVRLDNLFDGVSSNTLPVADERLAHVFDSAQVAVGRVRGGVEAAAAGPRP